MHLSLYSLTTRFLTFSTRGNSRTILFCFNFRWQLFRKRVKYTIRHIVFVYSTLSKHEANNLNLNKLYRTGKTVLAQRRTLRHSLRAKTIDASIHDAPAKCKTNDSVNTLIILASSASGWQLNQNARWNRVN